MYFGGVNATGPDRAIADPRRGGLAISGPMNFAADARSKSMG